MGTPSLMTATPSIDDARAAMEPTEISILPEMITSVMMSATIPKNAAFCRMLSWVSAVRNSGAMTESTTYNRIKTRSSPTQSHHTDRRKAASTVVGGDDSGRSGGTAFVAVVDMLSLLPSGPRTGFCRRWPAHRRVLRGYDPRE